jgi:hypothetical protein
MSCIHLTRRGWQGWNLQHTGLRAERINIFENIWYSREFYKWGEKKAPAGS